MQSVARPTERAIIRDPYGGSEIGRALTPGSRRRAERTEAIGLDEMIFVVRHRNLHVFLPREHSAFQVHLSRAAGHREIAAIIARHALKAPTTHHRFQDRVQQVLAAILRRHSDRKYPAGAWVITRADVEMLAATDVLLTAAAGGVPSRPMMDEAESHLKRYWRCP